FIASVPTCDCDHCGIRLRRPFLRLSIYDRKFNLISDRQLRKAISDLIELERKWFASRSRFAFYDYLAAVFGLYVQLRRTKQAKKAARLIAKLFGLHNQK